MLKPWLPHTKNISAFKNIDTSVVKRLGRRRWDEMWSVTAVAVSAYRGPGLDVCPPVQENLDGPEVAFLCSPVQGGPSILQRDREATRNTDTWTYLHTIPRS